MKRRGQIATFLIFFMLAFSFVVYMLEGFSPLLFQMAGCLGTSNVATGCAGFSTTGSLYYIITISVVALISVAAGAGLLGGFISTSSVSFPNPYLYFMPVALMIMGVGLLTPAQLFSTAIPTGIQVFITASISFFIFLGTVSWLKGGGMP